MAIQQTLFQFRNLDNKIYPDLNNYKFEISLNNIDTTVEVIEGWALGNLYVRINGDQVYPYRINTNLLPPSYGRTNKLYYDYNKQAFVFEYES